MVEQTPTSLALRLLLAAVGVMIFFLTRMFMPSPITYCGMALGIAFVVASLTTK